MYKLEKSIQYKGKYYRAGEVIKVDNKDLDEFLRRKIINNVSESPTKAFNRDKHTIGQEEGITREIEKEIDYSTFTVIELKTMLDNKGIEYKASDIKEDLIKLLKGE